MEQGKRKKRYSHAGNFVFLFLVVVMLIAVYTFILQKSYAHNTLEAAVERNISCSDGMHQVISNKFTREDYAEINDRADMKLERYQELQKSLNELRSLNSTRYLYTAKRDADGRLIYLVDGLDLLAEDFAYPGTYIEEEMIPYISAALDGETIYSQEIMDTTWGHIFTACYPVRATDGSHEIIGALCVEMDMESSYAWIETSNRRALGFAVMDVQMPVMNGYEATGKIRKLQDKSKAQIPIIAMTANAFAEDRQKALSVGMNDHVAKPIDMNTLIPVLQKYLQAKR